MCFISETGIGLLYQCYVHPSPKIRLYLWHNSIWQIFNMVSSLLNKMASMLIALGSSAITILLEVNGRVFARDNRFFLSHTVDCKPVSS